MFANSRLLKDRRTHFSHPFQFFVQENWVKSASFVAKIVLENFLDVILTQNNDFRVQHVYLDVRGR